MARSKVEMWIWIVAGVLPGAMTTLTTLHQSAASTTHRHASPAFLQSGETVDLAVSEQAGEVRGGLMAALEA